MRYGIWRGLPQYSSGVRKWDYGRAVGPRCVFVHIMEGHLSGTDGWFRNPASGTVSTHFGIGYASWMDRLIGKVSTYQWVDTANTAYGTAVTRNPVSPLGGLILGDLIRARRDVNPAIIHIEVEGYPYQLWPPGFVTALNALLNALKAHGPLMVMRHNDVSSKVCPGTAVPWSKIVPTYGRRLGATLPDTTPSVPLPAGPSEGFPLAFYNVVPYQATILAGKPIREGPSTKYRTIRTTDRKIGVRLYIRKPGQILGGTNAWFAYPITNPDSPGSHVLGWSPRIDMEGFRK